MTAEPLASAIASVPAGRWAVAVSGGADSVALLTLLRGRSDLTLHVVHLNHQLRGDESDQDAEFVRTLAARLDLPATVARRDLLAVETTSNNPSERYRLARLAMFRQTIEQHALSGVLLGHHLDDQIETVLHRLLRGSGYRGLCGMAVSDRVAGVTLCRPMLAIPRRMLREHLKRENQPWREDSSNAGANYKRNELRRFLVHSPTTGAALITLMEACRELKIVVFAVAKDWPLEIVLRTAASQPAILREQSARAWLLHAGVPSQRVDARTIHRLLEMIGDAGTAARVQLAGGRTVVRQGGKLRVVKQAAAKFE